MKILTTHEIKPIKLDTTLQTFKSTKVTW